MSIEQRNPPAKPDKIAIARVTRSDFSWAMA